MQCENNGDPLFGCITEMLADSKGFVCHVRMKTQTSELQRPINKPCLLMEAVC